MQSSSTNGFFLSALLHGSVAAIVLFGAYACQEKRKEPDHIIELVQGPGDYYSATDAPALGIEGGIKVNLPDSPPPSPTPPTPDPTPEPPAPAPEPVQQPPKPAPLPPAEKTPPTPAKVKPVVRDMAAKLKHDIIVAESRVKMRAKKEREAEAKKAREAEQRMSKAEFDRKNKSRASASTRGGTGKAVHIDAEGIRNGVVGGSTSNKKGGASGTALTRDQADAVDEYLSLLRTKIKIELSDRPGVGAGQVVEIELHLLPDGSITRVRVAKSSGNAEFDQVAKEAVQRVSMPSRPAGVEESLQVPIKGIDAN